MNCNCKDKLEQYRERYTRAENERDALIAFIKHLRVTMNPEELSDTWRNIPAHLQRRIMAP